MQRIKGPIRGASNVLKSIEALVNEFDRSGQYFSSTGRCRVTSGRASTTLRFLTSFQSKGDTLGAMCFILRDDLKFYGMINETTNTALHISVSH